MMIKVTLRKTGNSVGLVLPREVLDHLGAALDSVLSRPRERFATGVDDLGELAVCYAAGLAVQHPFVSGDLALGIIVATTFLRCNGFMFEPKWLT
jgi:prophage maintenance system killer protein